MDPIARFALTAATVPAFIALERWLPRRRAAIDWRAIVLGGALLVLNTLLLRGINYAPDSAVPARIVLAWVLVEVVTYGLHRAMHRVPLLWRVHRLHHAPGTLAWHRSWWIHPADLALFALATDLACVVAGAPHATAAWLVIVRRYWSVLLHANVAWPQTPLDHVIVTPSFHERHHREELAPANFAATFSIVDHLFGTHERAMPATSATSSSTGTATVVASEIDQAQPRSSRNQRQPARARP